MNYLRILRLTNLLFLFCCGYQWHWFEQKTRRYRLSFLGILNFVLIVILFVICCYHHFQQSALLQWIHEYAPLLEKLIQLQLFLGAQVLVTLLYTMKSLMSAANGFHELLPRNVMQKFILNETIAYALLFETFLLGFGFTLFMGYELDFKLPSMNNLLIGGAIFIPHSIASCALKFFNIYTWFACTLFNKLEKDVAQQLQMETTNAMTTNGTETCETGVINVVSCCDTQLLRNFQDQLKGLVASLQDFFDAVKRQIWLLFMLNAHCFLGAVYALVYYRNFWSKMFEAPEAHLFYAANIAIFVLIGFDYLCLLLLQNYLYKLRSKLVLSLDKAIQQHSATHEKATCSILKDMRLSLKNAFQFKFSGGIRLTVSNFVRLHFYLGLIIAITVIYYFLSDQILAVNKRLDIANTA